jgi:hypothetical protein
MMERIFGVQNTNSFRSIPIRLTVALHLLFFFYSIECIQLPISLTILPKLPCQKKTGWNVSLLCLTLVTKDPE